MPRNGSGAYSLPTGNPVITGTTISSTVHNSTMTDLASEMTNSIDKDGQTVWTGAQDANGNKIILDVDGDTSITADTDDQVDIEIGGSDVVVITPTVLTVPTNVKMPSTTNNILTSTSDGSDTAVIHLAGGGGGATRTTGAYVSVYGNEHATVPGGLYLRAGEAGAMDVQAATVAMTIGGASALTIDGNQDVSIPAGSLGITNPADTDGLQVYAGNASFTADVIQANTARAANSAFNLINLLSAGSSKFSVDGVGNVTVVSGAEVFLNLPTSAGTAGSLWSDSGTVKVA